MGPQCGSIGCERLSMPHVRGCNVPYSVRRASHSCSECRLRTPRETPGTLCGAPYNLFLLYSFNRKSDFQQKKILFRRSYSHFFFFFFALFYSQIGENKKKIFHSISIRTGEKVQNDTPEKKIRIRFSFAHRKKVQNDTPGTVFH